MLLYMLAAFTMTNLRSRATVQQIYYDHYSFYMSCWTNFHDILNMNNIGQQMLLAWRVESWIVKIERYMGLYWLYTSSYVFDNLCIWFKKV